MIRFLGILMLIAVVAGAAANPQDGQKLLGHRSLALSNDGRYVAYNKVDNRPAGNQELWLTDLAIGQSQIIDIVVPASVSTVSALVPVSATRWSPDGMRLAYFALSGDGAMRVRIWSRAEQRVSYESHRPLCWMNVNVACLFNATLEWTPDSRQVLFVSSDPPPLVSTTNAPSGNLSDFDQEKRELRGYHPSKNGLTVVMTPAMERMLGVERPSVRPERRTEITSIDVEARRERTLATGSVFISVRILDKRTALAFAVEPFTQSGPQGIVYRIPFDVRGSLYTEQLLPRVTRPDAELSPNVGISPSGRYAAFTGDRYTTDGDVFVLDLRKGRIRNLTSSLKFPAGQARSFMASVFNADWKFGSQTAPIWSRDERTVYVLHAVERIRGQSSFHYEVWSVDINGGPVRKVPLPADVSIVALNRCSDTGAPCLLGERQELVARVRIERPLPEADTIAIAAIDLHGGAIRILRKIGPAGVAGDPHEPMLAASSQDLVASSGTAFVIDAAETQEQPLELWRLPLSRNAQPQRLQALNPGPTPSVGQYLSLSLGAVDGREVTAALRLPAGAEQGSPLPVIAVVYPGRTSSMGDGQFDGGGGYTQWWRPIRATHGFATLAIDIPTFALPGDYCDNAAKSVDAALDAAVATGWVDEKRIGLMGHSYGSFVVKCVITRLNRITAAISIAGVTDVLKAGPHGPLGPWAPGSPSEYPEQYMRGTPYFHLAKVTTPLMLVYGKKDIPSMSSEIDMYDALSANGKLAQLVAYDAYGHFEMFQDPQFWFRARDWFRTFFDRVPP